MIQVIEQEHRQRLEIEAGDDGGINAELWLFRLFYNERKPQDDDDLLAREL